MSAWSYSALTAFEQCGRKFAMERVFKTIRVPESEQMLYGQRVHKSLENRVKDGTLLPDDIKHLEPTIQVLTRLGRCLPEERYALDRSFRLTEYFDRAQTPVDRRVWLRIVIDLQIMLTDPRYAILLDYKTGKVKDDLDQLELFAAVMFTMHPRLEEVRTGYLWTAQNQLTKQTFNRDEVPIIWQKFVPRVQRLEQTYQTNDWKPNPSGLCRKHCDVMTCEYHGKGNH